MSRLERRTCWEVRGMAGSGDHPEVRLVADCRRCRGWLLSAKSIAEGIGPTCAIRERAERRTGAAVELTLFDFAA
ncbi:DUF6011 domain-containing protein [Nocardia thailandica]|uniref:DUF6011 domain-containing protein n=1 Tax=Nocardia thailandica TaxID=257275 RepID=A0ABW6PX70_9NOCA